MVSWLSRMPSGKEVWVTPNEGQLQSYLGSRGWMLSEEGWRRPPTSTLEDRFYDLHEAASVQLFLEGIK